MPMIKGFKCRETERIWRNQRSRRLPQDIQVAALRKLRYLNRAKRLDDLRMPPANRPEALKSDRAGQHGIRINRQWRVCFRWEGADASDVEIADCH